MDNRKKKSTLKNNELDELQTKYLRALADYQNLEKRMHNDQVGAESRIKGRVISTFLPILDDLEKAEIFVQDDGLRMILQQFKASMKSLGVEEIDVLGKEYDPYTAEAIEIIEGEKDNIVTDISKKGYRIGDEVIRPAQVTVSKKTL